MLNKYDTFWPRQQPTYMRADASRRNSYRNLMLKYLFRQPKQLLNSHSYYLSLDPWDLPFACLWNIFLTWLRGFHGNTLLSNLRVLPYVNVYVDTSHQYIVTFHCPCSGCTWPVQLFHGFQRQCSKDTKFCVNRFPKLLHWSTKNLSVGFKHCIRSLFCVYCVV